MSPHLGLSSNAQLAAGEDFEASVQVFAIAIQRQGHPSEECKMKNLYSRDLVQSMHCGVEL
jgi:hypothetical protein